MTIALVRMWKDWNPYTLLLSLFSKVVSPFCNLKIPQNIKDRVTVVAVVQLLICVWLFATPCIAAHARLPSSSPFPGACSNLCPLNQCCNPTISSSVIPFSSHFQSFPASRSFPVSQLVASGGQSIGVLASTSVLPMNIQDWFPLGLTGLISLLSKGLSRVFSNTTVQKHQFLALSFLYGPTLTSMHDYWKNGNWLDGPLSAKWCLYFWICCLGLA